jgi:hypothetical protein
MKNISPLVKCALVASALWFAVPSTFATAYTWTNKVSGYWTNSANWNPNGVPTNGDSASLPAFINANMAITLDGGDRTLAGSLSLEGSGSSYNNSLILNLDSGAALRTRFELYRLFAVVVSNGTLLATGESRIGGSNASEPIGASVTLNGGNLYVTNGAGLWLQQGRDAGMDSTLQINSGAFTFRSEYKLTVGQPVGAYNYAGKAVMNVAGGTADVGGSADEMIIMNADRGRIATGIVNVTSGTLTAFTNTTSKRIIVGGREGSRSGDPALWFSTNLAQLNVSGSGVVNAGGWGAFVGRNSGASPGEVNVNGGDASFGGFIVGDWGKLSQTSGVLRFTASQQFLNEATNNVRHLFMTGGLTLFQGISSNKMTIDMGAANAGNVLGQGFYNVQFGSNGGSAFTIDLSNPFYGCGDVNGGNQIFGDGIKDLVIWTNTIVKYNSVTYSGVSGGNSLMDFATLATPWGWDISVGAIPEPGVVGLVALGGLLAVVFRRRKA